MSGTPNPAAVQTTSEPPALVPSSIVMKASSPSVICDIPGELVLLRDMPLVENHTLNESLLMRIPHTVKHIFNPSQQDIHLQPGRHDQFGQELFRCEFAYLANILPGSDPDRCDIIIRLVHSSARRARDEHATRLLQTITIMLGNELASYIERCQVKAKDNKKAPNYYRPYVRKKKGANPPKTATPPQKPN